MNATPVRRRSGAALLMSAIALIAACGGEDPTLSVPEPAGSVASTAGAGTVAFEPVPADTAPENDEPATSVAPVEQGAPSPVSTAAPVTAAPPTTVPALPIPALIPLEDDTEEPVIELGSIVIPAIGIDRPLYEGIRLPTFDRGPGHWPGTAMPGQLGNVVVGGHRTESNADFGDLDRLQPGDEVMFNDTAGAAVTYVVTSTEIIDPFAAVIVNQTRAYTATLFACHPKGSTDQRIVVRLELKA